MHKLHLQKIQYSLAIKLMSSFAQSQVLYSPHPTTFKLRKNLSIETSTSTNRRGLSLVSSRGSESISVSKKNIGLKQQVKQSVKKSPTIFFSCSPPLCDIFKVSQQQEIVELRQKKVVSHTMRQRNMNILSRDLMGNWSSTQRSFCGSNADTLWDPKSPDLTEWKRQKKDEEQWHYLLRKFDMIDKLRTQSLHVVEICQIVASNL